MTHGSQNAIIPTDLPSFPWVPRDPLDAIPLNNKFLEQQALIDSLANSVAVMQSAGGSTNGTSITIDWGGNNIVTSGFYMLTARAPYILVLSSMDVFVGGSGGSFEVTVLINNQPVAGFTNVLVDQPRQMTYLSTAPNSVAVGGQLAVVISNVVGFPSNCWVGLNSAAIVALPTYNTGAGQASGVGRANAVSAIAFASIGNAPGTSTAIGRLASVLTSQMLASASGSSTASAIGRSTSFFAPLALDDTSQPGLDFSPLG